MQITIAGYGTIGHYVEQVFGSTHTVRVYDPPLGFGRLQDLRDTDFVFICVPTPPDASGACDTSIMEEVVRLADPRQAIVCHSTVSIGTTDGLIEETGKPLVFSPEYAGEQASHPFRDPANRSFFIFGGYEPATSAVQALFESAYGQAARYSCVPPRTAEVVKYMENAFLATKVAFCNEFFDLCAAIDADYGVVRELWTQDERITDSHTYVTAERGYGGQCLPKDIAAVTYSAREAGSPMTILEAVQRANEVHRARGRAHRSAEAGVYAAPDLVGGLVGSS